jgi:WD40 repeat protein
MKTGQEEHLLKGHSGYVHCVIVSKDGGTIVSGSEDETINIWDTATGSLKKTLEGHSSNVNSLAFSKLEESIISGSYDKTIKVWEVKTGNLKMTFQGHAYSVTSVAFSCDGRLVMSGSDDQLLKVWDIQGGQVQNVLEGHSLPVRYVAFLNNGTHILTEDYGGQIYYWNLATCRRGDLSSVRVEETQIKLEVHNNHCKGIFTKTNKVIGYTLDSYGENGVTGLQVVPNECLVVAAVQNRFGCWRFA